MQQDEELHCYSSGTLLALQAIIFCILEVSFLLFYSVSNVLFKQMIMVKKQMRTVPISSELNQR